MYIGLHVKYKLFSSILMKPEFYRKLFEKYNKFNGNPVGADGQKNRRTDITKLIVAFRNFADAPKKT